ncbi:MAG: hypothetical protein U0935_02965 [Pirellulales bacterium]
MIDLDRMVDHEVDRDERIDARIATQPTHRRRMAARSTTAGTP